MRRVVVTLLVAGCSAHAPPSSNAPTQSAPAPVAVEIPPAEPAMPAEPAGLVTLTRPERSLCELKGALVDGGVDLAGLGGGPAFGTVSNGEATLSFGADGNAFAEVRLSTSTVLRGFTSREVFLEQGKTKTLALVFAKRWVAFGGVFYPGLDYRMRVQGVKGGKIVVATHAEAGAFDLAESARVLEVSCADISLTPDPEGELRKQAPPAFLASGKEQFMWLTGSTPVAVSAVAGGSASGSFEVTPDEPLQVVVLERRGPSARIRYGYVAGWIDAARLSAKEPKGATEVGGLGLVGMGEGAPADTKAPLGRRVSCNADVRLVAVQGAARFVVGTIARGQAFVISDEADDLAYLASDGSAVQTNTGVRLAVPMRDATGCAEAVASTPDALGRWTPQNLFQPAMKDAVSVLRDAPPSKSNAKRASGSDQQVGMIGLSGTEPYNQDVRVPGARSIGEGVGHGTSADSSRPKQAKLRQGAVTVSGKLPPEVVTRIVRQNFGRFRLCYEEGLKKNPALEGRLSARFVIAKQGNVSNVSNGGTSLSDQAVVQCVIKAFYGLNFPQPEAGIVTVLFPLQFSPE